MGDGAQAQPRIIRVLVVDDQAIVRDGLVTILELLPDIEVVGQAADGAQAVELARRTRPDVVLMDLRMPVLDGAGATERIVDDSPATAVLVLTTFGDDDSIRRALRAGARGYLTKDAGRAELAAAIRSVAAGQSTFSREVGDVLLAGMVAASASDTRPADTTTSRRDALAHRFPSLTPRELDVFTLVGEGLSNTEIASELYVGVTTVKTHINAIFSKLSIRDRAHAITLIRS